MQTSTLFISDYSFDDMVLLELDANLRLIEATSHLNFEQLSKKALNPLSIVLASHLVSIYPAEMPLQTDAKAKMAIPFFLEEQVANELHELHFAFDKKFHHNGCYTVAVIAKDLMQELTTLCAQHQLSIASISCDVFALESNQGLIQANELLVNSANFQGSINADLLDGFKSRLPMDLSLLKPTDANATIAKKLELSMPQVLNKSANELIAKALASHPGLDFCQGEFKTQASTNTTHTLWKAALGACLIFLCTSLSLKLLQHHSLAKKQHAMQDEISTIYKQFFPGATQVVSPRFRIEQALKQHAQPNAGKFIALSERLGKVLDKQQEVDIQQLEFRNQRLKLSLLIDTFAKLSDFKKALNAQGLTVIQNSASSTTNAVTASLELSL